jgi:hypothetical protein
MGRGKKRAEAMRAVVRATANTVDMLMLDVSDAAVAASLDDDGVVTPEKSKVVNSLLEAAKEKMKVRDERNAVNTTELWAANMKDPVLEIVKKMIVSRRGIVGKGKGKLKVRKMAKDATLEVGVAKENMMEYDTAEDAKWAKASLALEKTVQKQIWTMMAVAKGNTKNVLIEEAEAVRELAMAMDVNDVRWAMRAWAKKTNVARVMERKLMVNAMRDMEAILKEVEEKVKMA